MSRRFAVAVCGRRIKWIVVVFWVAVMIVGGMGASKLTDVENNEASSWLPGDAESTKALEASEGFSNPDTMPTTVVYERDGGITEADRQQVAEDIEAFGAMDGTKAPELAGDEATDDDPTVTIDGPIGQPELSDDGESLRVSVPVNTGGPEGWEAMPDVVDHMRDIAGDGADGMVTHVTGPGGNAADLATAFEGIDGTLLLAAAAVVVLILLLTYRSPVLWILPLVSAGIALTSAQGVIYLLAKYADLTVNAQSTAILAILVFGAGTDYALLLIARYREELHRHEDRHEAMAEALHRAGPAIIASGGTVVLGMLCLLVAEMNSTQGLGPVLAIGVTVGLLAMVSLLPALLVIVGRWIFWPKRPHFDSVEPTTTTGVWARIGRVIAIRPRAVWIGTAVVLGALALGMTNLNATSLTNAEQFGGDTPDSIKGDTVLAEHFTSDEGSPVQIVTDAKSAEAVSQAAADTEGIGSVGEPMVAGDTAYIEADLAGNPVSDAAYDTVERVRDSVHAVPGSDALVGGASAFYLDTREASQHDNKLVIPMVLIVVFLILVALLRALVAPLILMATVILSFGAALGVSAMLFGEVFSVDNSDSAFPLWVFVFLVALGIDYNIFLMTRVREEAAKVGSRRGALIGLGATGGVITSAGLVLAGTFGTLATIPMTFLIQMGFAVAFGVLLDTIIVRSVLVTALNLDLGRRMWWPSRLGRREHDEQFEDPDPSQEKELVPVG
ncbi:MAG TPA: MMPL family transporter [Nocardioidaceae bacterium]|nr:MMPL family transporter [Nocardioidaceae bacterium]